MGNELSAGDRQSDDMKELYKKVLEENRFGSDSDYASNKRAHEELKKR